MTANDRSSRVHVLRATGASVSLSSEHLIAIIGCVLMARSVLASLHHGDEITWGVGLTGALVVILALTTIARPASWQFWAQVALGFGLYLVALFLTFDFDRPDWITVVAGFAIIILAGTEIDALGAARERDRHLGWRRPSPGSGRALRLVYSSDVPCLVEAQQGPRLAGNVQVRTLTPQTSVCPRHLRPIGSPPA